MNKGDNSNGESNISQSFQNTSSLLSLWKTIAPKISFARKIVYSAVIDLLESQNLDKCKEVKENTNVLSWKNTEKSVWTLSTIEKKHGSPSNIYINPSVLKEIVALDKELSSVLQDLNLSHKEKSSQLLEHFISHSNKKLSIVGSKKGNNFCILPYDASTQSQATSYGKNEEPDKVSSSISLYSNDSIDSETPEESEKPKKKNLVIKCNYALYSRPSSKNTMHVYRQCSCDLSETSCPSCCPPKDKTSRSSTSCIDKCKKIKEKASKEKQKRERALEKKRKKEDEKKRKSQEALAKKRQRSAEAEARKRRREERKKLRSDEALAKRRRREERKYIKCAEACERKERRRARRASKSRSRSNDRKRKAPNRCDGAYSERKVDEGKMKCYEGPERQNVKKEHKRSRSSSRDRKRDRSCSEERGRKRSRSRDHSSRESSEIRGGSTTRSSSLSSRGIPCCKSTQAANLKRSICSEAQAMLSTPRCSRLSRFMSSFKRGGIQVRVLHPRDGCKETRSCILPKFCVSRSCNRRVPSIPKLPRVRICRKPEPCPPQPCTPPSPCTPPPCTPPPCALQPCSPPPVCNFRPSAPRLRPCRIPSHKIKSCHTPPIYNPPSCKPSPCKLSCYTPKTCGSRPCSQTSDCRCTQPCSQSPCGLPPPCHPAPCTTCCSPRVNSTPSVCKFAPRRPCTSPPCDSSPCNRPSLIRLTPKYLTPSHHCNSCSGNAPPSCRATSPCNSSPFKPKFYAPCNSRPCTPPSCKSAPCRPMPCRPTPPCRPRSCSPGPCQKEYLPKPCFYEPCIKTSVCKTTNPCCDSDCNVSRWSCCSPRRSRCRSPTCSRVSICEPVPCQPCSPPCSATNVCSRRSVCPPKPCPTPKNLHSCSESECCIPRYPRRTVCRPKRYDRPWWAPPCDIFDDCYDYRRRCGPRRYWSPYCSDDEYYYCGRPPWWYDGPCGFEDSCHRLPWSPRGCSSISYIPAPCRPRSCSLPPCRSLPCTPPSCYSPAYSPCPTPPFPPYPPCSPPPPCLPYPPCPQPPYPPPCYPPQCPPSPPPPCYPPYPPCVPSPCPSRTSLGFRVCKPPKLCTPRPVCSPPRICAPPKLCGPPKLCRPKGPKCGPKLCGFPKPCFPKSCSLKPPCSPCGPSPCMSPVPSCTNFPYPGYPSSSCLNNQWPYPYYYPPYYAPYGGFESCYPSQIQSKSSFESGQPKLTLSRYKRTRTYQKRRKSPPKHSISRSSSEASLSSCSSSSVGKSSYSTTSSSSSTSSCSSKSSVSFCVASCKSSPFNIRKFQSPCSSTCSSNCSPRLACTKKTKCPTPKPRCVKRKPCEQHAEPKCCRKICRSQVCSSATDICCEANCNNIDHYDQRVRFELQKIGITQLLKASKPAKCCRQTLLNQPSREDLPYAASLASLPLDRTDIRVIRQSIRMAENKTNCNLTSLENRTKLVYYANLVTDDFNEKKPAVEPKFEVRYFYYVPGRVDKGVDAEKRDQISTWPSDESFQNLGKSIFDINNCVIPFKEEVITPFLVPKNRMKNRKLGIKSRSTEEVPSNISPTIENFSFTDTLVDNIYDCKNVIFRSFKNILKSRSISKQHTISQTDISKSDIDSEKVLVTSDAMSQTQCINDGVLNDFVLSQEIMRIFSNSRNGNKQKTPKSTDTLHNVSEDFEEAIMSVLGGINQLVTMTDSFRTMKSKNENSERSADFMPENTLCSTLSAKSSPFNSTKISEVESQSKTEDKIKDVEKKESLILEILDSINNLIDEIFEEATNLAELRRHRFAALRQQNEEKGSISEEEVKKEIREEIVDTNLNQRGEFGQELLKVLMNVTDNNQRKRTKIRSGTVYTSTGKIVTRFYDAKGKILKGLYTQNGGKITEKTTSVGKLAKVLFTTKGNFTGNCYDSQGNLLKAVYDSQRQILKRTYNSKMLLMKCPLEVKRGTNRIFNSLGFPVHHLYTKEGNLLTSIYDLRGNLIRGTFLGNVCHMFPRIFDGRGRFIQGRCNANGEMIKSIFDSYGCRLQEIYKADKMQFRGEPTIFKIVNEYGEKIEKLYNKNKVALTYIYDVLGNLLCYTIDGNARDLLGRLFDLNGHFIVGRFDELGRLIEGVYDKNLNKIYRIQVLENEMENKVKLYNFKGEPLTNFYDSNGVCLKNIYDTRETLVENSSSGRALKLACRLFDIAGYFIIGRYDAGKNLIRKIYDNEKCEISQIYDINGKPIRKTVQPNKIYTGKGKIIKHFYTSDQKILMKIHDVNGCIIGGVMSENAEEIAPYIFDIEGKFISSRYDSRMNLIKNVYDSNANIIEKIDMKQNSKHKEKFKTVYVKLDCNDCLTHNFKSRSFTSAFGNLCLSQNKSYVPPLLLKNCKAPRVKSRRKFQINSDVLGRDKHLFSEKTAKYPWMKNTKKSEFNRIFSRKYDFSRKFQIARTPTRTNYSKGFVGILKKETGKSSSTVKTKAKKSNQDEEKRGGIRGRKSSCKDRKAATTIMSCYDAARGPNERNTDSLESFLDSYMEDEDLKHKRIAYKKTINHEMVEKVFMECLNLSKNSKCSKTISQIILQYFTHVVFNQIKCNYHERLSKIHENCGKYQDTNEFYFSERNTCAISLHLNKLTIKEPENVSSLSQESFETVANSETDLDKTNNEQDESTSPIETENICNSKGEVSVTISEQTFRDAFLCNLPNAPPFILKMKKTSLDALTDEMGDITVCSEVSLDELVQRSTLASSSPDCQFSVKMADNLNSYTFPSFENQAFEEFITKSFTLMRRKEEQTYLSSPTICMTGLTGMSSNPFKEDEVDAKDPGQMGRNSCNTTDILYKRKSYHCHSKIPRMLHPGKCKVHTKLKSVQMTPGARSGCAANRAQSSSSKGCCTSCPSKSESNTKTSIKVTVSTGCPSFTNACGKQNANPTSQSSMGDCAKGIKSDPGCYCGNPPLETKPCPVRAQEDCVCVEEEEPEPEEEEALCYCPPGEQPLLMKKSNIECDCANRRRCEDETLIEPPKEKPNVFWALTKVSLLKDGTKNFEIIDVSPVPPGYYLMPDVNNLVLVGPQPKPAKPAPSKNCCCK